MTRPMIQLRTMMDVNGETLFAQVPVDQEVWRDASDEMRDSLRNLTREALGRVIVERYSPDVTVIEEEPTLAEAMQEALAEHDAENDPTPSDPGSGE